MAVRNISAAKALQLPEGYTVRKVGNILKVVRKRKTAIVNKNMTKKITSQRELEQFVNHLFEKQGKRIVCRLLTNPKRYEIKVNGREVTDEWHVEQYKAYNEALEKSGIGGKLAYKWNEKKDCPEWTYKEAQHA
jgi:hypothetical protein